MIGVAADTADLAIVEECFDLFTTPWERAVPGRKYRVVVSVQDIENLDAELYGAGWN
jgi:hypothetical protein